MNTLTPLVSICCITYNHENYIKDAIEGFLRQKTNFPIEIIIHDDASTDGTADIVKCYADKNPDLILPIFQTENQYSKKQGSISVRFVWPRARGKYIALCEGDDYWTDPYKLQKQVDFLESNPEFGLIYSKAKAFDQKSGKFIGCIGDKREKFEDLLLGNKIPTVTTCLNHDLLNRYLLEVKPETKKWLMGDYPIWLYIVHESKIKFDNTITAVYRVLESSASHPPTISGIVSFIVGTYEIAGFYLHKYCCSNYVLTDCIIEHYMWRLFSVWCRCNNLQIKDQIEHEIEKITYKKSIKIRLIRITFKIPILRYMFIWYYEIRKILNLA